MSAPYYDEGSYVGEIIQQAITETKTGKPQLLLRVKVLGIPEDDGTFSPVGRQYERSIYMVLTPATVPFTAENLRTAGFEGDKISELEPSSPNHQSLVGNQINLWCKHEPHYQTGEPQERWQISKGRQVIEVKPLDSKGLRSLDSLFSKALKATPAPAKGKSRVKPEDENQDDTRLEEGFHNHVASDGSEITDEDIPF
jgi:hypothetical protein